MTDLKRFFDAQRIFRIIRLALTDEWRPFLLTGFLFFLLILLSSMTFFRMSVDFLFKLMLFTGIIFTSRTLGEFQERDKGTYLMMIPASMEEKYLVRLLATLIGYYFYSVLVCILASEVANFISIFVLGRTSFEQHLTTDLTNAFCFFMFFHAVFFWGSLFFRKNAFLKTSLILIGIFFIIMFSAGHLFLRNMMGGHHNSFYFSYNGDDWQGMFGSALPMFNLLRIFVCLVIPLILYVITYIRFRNIQIKA